MLLPYSLTHSLLSEMFYVFATLCHKIWITFGTRYVNAEEFVCLDALISGTSDPIWKVLSVFDSSFIEEGYTYIIYHRLKFALAR